MTYEDAVRLLAILKAAYPSDYPYNMSVKDAKAMAVVWSRQFPNEPYEIVKIAVEKLISTEEKVFAPATVKKQLGSMYWEAQSMLGEARRGFVNVPEEEILLFEHIKKVTEQYRYSKAIEPSIKQLVGEDTKTLLLGGKVSERN